IPSSTETIFFSPSFVTSIGKISRSKYPSSTASIARWWLSNENSSSVFRLMSHLLAICSADNPCGIIECLFINDSGNSPISLPIGTRDILSTPHAMTISISPAAIAWEAYEWLADLNRTNDLMNRQALLLEILQQELRFVQY